MSTFNDTEEHLFEDLLQRISHLRDTDNHLAERVSTSLSILDQAFSQFDVSTVVLSFNGGKDNTVAVFLTFYYFLLTNSKSLRQSGKPPSSVLNVYFFHVNETFPEMLQYMEEVAHLYSFSVCQLSGSFKECLSLLQSKGVNAVITGLRRTDPYSMNISSIAESTVGWPSITRISPVLDWSYHDVWSFILKARIPYCKLYQDGYTSLGSPSQTMPNSSLLLPCGKRYLHACFLQNSEEERLGRL
ncbi:hypothetical protein P9112_005654 [Eukaryota sp. TZLM1-RC]